MKKFCQLLNTIFKLLALVTGLFFAYKYVNRRRGISVEEVEKINKKTPTELIDSIETFANQTDSTTLRTYQDKEAPD